MVPFLSTHQGISIKEACEIFNVTERELIADLNLLWVCGLPGYSHLELIDVQFDGGYISISNADPISRPRKLTYEESSALIVALNSLLLNVENQSREQIVNLIAKLVRISDREDPIVSIDVSTLAKLPEIHLIDKAIIENLQLSIDYYSPTTDSLTSRVIAPLEYIEDSSGKRYVYAWCYGAEDFRQFKLDRIRTVKDTDEKAEKFGIPSKPLPSQMNSIELELNEKALWFAEEWGIQNLERNPANQGFVGTVNLHNHEWAIRAVMAMGGDLRIPKDAILKREIAVRAAAALANYPS
jgi:proteasome accessory factor C